MTSLASYKRACGEASARDRRGNHLKSQADRPVTQSDMDINPKTIVVNIENIGQSGDDGHFCWYKVCAAVWDLKAIHAAR